MNNPSSVVSDGKVGLPPKNTLLPKKLDILPEDSENSKVPQKIQEYNETEVWYKKDDKFNRPKAVINIKIYPQQGILEGLGMTVRGRMQTELWIAAIKEYLREFNYMASMASLELEFTINQDAIQLEFSGFDDSLPEFLTQALTKIRQFSSLDKLEMQDIFNQVKEKLMQDWYNFYLEQSYRQAAATLESIILTPAFTKRQLRDDLENYSFEDFFSAVN